MSDSDIERIEVYVTNENPRSLAEHVGNGRNYNINSKRGLLQLMFSHESTLSGIYNTDVKAYLDNAPTLERAHQDYVIITPGYMIFRQDFKQLLQQHIDSGADITLLCHRTDKADTAYRNCFTVDLNRQKGVRGIGLNDGNKADRNIFMDTYVLSRDLFLDLLKRGQKTSAIYRFVDIVSHMTDELDIRAVQHKGYFAAITDFKAYFDANIDLLDIAVADDLFVNDWPIYTRTTDSCPVLYRKGASVSKSMVANGTIIEGSVENSVIGRGVSIEKGAVVKNCVILGHTVIGKDVHMENMVVDKWAKVLNMKEIVAPADEPGYIRRMDII